MPLTQEQIENLINKPRRGTKQQAPTEVKTGPTRLELLFPPKEQRGPIRRFDSDALLKCAKTHKSFRCESPAYYKLQGIPYCSTHLIELVNEILIEKGVN